MTTKSGKAKGRRLQQKLRDLLLEYDPKGAYESRAMGQAGSDIVDPLDRLPWDYVECRNRELWPSLKAIVEEMEGKSGPNCLQLWTAMLARNRAKPVFVVSEDLMNVLLEAYLTGCIEQ